MSAALLCSSCFHPIAPDDLTQAVVLGDAVTSLGALCLQTAIVHVDCADPCGEFVYDCRRRYRMEGQDGARRDRDEQELDEGKGPGEGEGAQEAAGERQSEVREELQRDRDRDGGEQSR